MEDAALLRARLRAAGERRLKATIEREQATAELIPLVREAAATGLGPTEIAEVSGLSRTAVYDILRA